MNDNLQATLNNLIESGSQSNPAMNALINDYTQYHVVFVVMGGPVAVIFGLLSLYFGIQGWRAPMIEQRTWTFEKTTYISFALLSLVIGLLMALIVAANASNVADPKRGFSLVIDSIVTPTVSTPPYTLYQGFNMWLQSGSSNIPSVIQAKLDERIVFHTLKALVCGLVLVVFSALNIRIWRTLIRRFRVQKAQRRLKDITLLSCGAATIGLSLLLMIMIVASTQAAFAPKTLTLVYG